MCGGDCWLGRPPPRAATAPPQMLPGCAAVCAFPGLQGKGNSISRVETSQCSCDIVGRPRQLSRKDLRKQLVASIPAE